MSVNVRIIIFDVTCFIYTSVYVAHVPDR